MSKLKSKKNTPIFFSLLFLFVLIGCQPENNSSESTSDINSPGSTAPGSTEIASLETELSTVTQNADATHNALTTIIGEASCDNDNQCGAIPLGKRICGGPAAYLPYSSKNYDTTLIIQLSNEHQTLSQKINRLNNQISILNGLGGIAGICEYLSPPIVSCQSAQCRVTP